MQDVEERFSELLAANARYAADFRLSGLTGRAARGLAVVTCMDSRIEPLQLLGLAAGDAKILRTAGARATDDVVSALALAVERLDVDLVLLMPHTDCAAGSGDSQIAGLHADVELLRTDDRLAASRPAVVGARYDVHTGRLDVLAPLA